MYVSVHIDPFDTYTFHESAVFQLAQKNLVLWMDIPVYITSFYFSEVCGTFEIYQVEINGQFILF